MRTFLFIIILTFSFTDLAFSFSKARKEVRKGNVLYNKGKFKEALKSYKNALEKNPESDVINFNMGTALYKTRDYKKAMEHFEKAGLSGQRHIEQMASYNLGNSLYKYGIGFENSELAKAINLLKRSLKSYEYVMKLDPEDKDAKFNYEFVKKELDRLLKKLKQQQKKSESKKQEDKKTEEEKERKRAVAEKRQKQTGKKLEGQGNKREKEDTGKKQEKEAKKEETEKGDKLQGEETIKHTQPETTQARPESGVANLGEISKEEADMLLEAYRYEEEPKGLYRKRIPTSSLPEDYKDW